jgi:hypothetical protein
MSELQPIKRFNRGRCAASVFINEYEKDGQTIRIPKTVFQKRYLDRDGAWRTTQSLDTSDLPRAILCLQDAFDLLTKSPNADENVE